MFLSTIIRERSPPRRISKDTGVCRPSFDTRLKPAPRMVGDQREPAMNTELIHGHLDGGPSPSIRPMGLLRSPSVSSGIRSSIRWLEDIQGIGP